MLPSLNSSDGFPDLFLKRDVDPFVVRKPTRDGHVCLSDLVVAGTRRSLEVRHGQGEGSSQRQVRTINLHHDQSWRLSSDSASICSMYFFFVSVFSFMNKKPIYTTRRVF